MAGIAQCDAGYFTALDKDGFVLLEGLGALFSVLVLEHYLERLAIARGHLNEDIGSLAEVDLVNALKGYLVLGTFGSIYHWDGIFADGEIAREVKEAVGGAEGDGCELLGGGDMELDETTEGQEINLALTGFGIVEEVFGQGRPLLNGGNVDHSITDIGVGGIDKSTDATGRSGVGQLKHAGGSVFGHRSNGDFYGVERLVPCHQGGIGGPMDKTGAIAIEHLHGGGNLGGG